MLGTRSDPIEQRANMASIKSNHCEGVGLYGLPERNIAWRESSPKSFAKDAQKTCVSYMKNNDVPSKAKTVFAKALQKFRGSNFKG